MDISHRNYSWLPFIVLQTKDLLNGPVIAFKWRHKEKRHLSSAILIIAAVIGIYFGYRLFCTGSAQGMRRMSGALLAVLSVVALVACVQNRRQPESAGRHSPTLRFLRQERPSSPLPGHGKIGVEQFT